MCKTKYLIIISAILLLSGIAFAQLNESFTGTMFPPDGWTRYNLGATPGDSWDRYTVYYHTAPACARIYYDLPNNDWLITPKLVVSAGDSLKFWWRKQSTSYEESLYIRVSTTSTDTSAFTVFLDSMFGPVGDTTWHYKACNLSAYAGNNVYLAFFYKDNNNYGVAIDDVTGPAVWMPTNDVGVQQILSPGIQHLVNTQMTPSAKIKNYGTNGQNNFTVICSIIGNSSGYLYSNSKIISLASGRDTTINFNSWTPTTTELCTVYVRTMLTDDNPFNDRKKSACDISSYITIGTGTTASSLYPMYRLYRYSVTEAIYLQSEIGYYGSITDLAYYKATGTDVTPIESVAIFMKHTAATTVATGAWDTTGYTCVFAGAFTNNTPPGWMNVTLSSPFLYNNSDNLQILILKGGPAVSTGYPTWNYTSTSPDNRNRYGYGASIPTSLTQTISRPNIRFALTPGAPPANDVGVSQILSPSSTHFLGALMTPSAKVKNYGTANQTSFAVICSIVSPTGAVRYTNTKSISLAAGRDTIVNFNSWTPTIAELCTVKMRTALLGDANIYNDRKTQTTDISSNIYIGTGTSTSASYPIYCYSAYSVSEAIYLLSEIGYVGNITNLAYYKGSGTDLNPIQYVTIYMKHTTATTVATGTWDYSGYTQVFSGSFPNDATAGWMDITLDSPFAFNNTDNLQILVVKGPYSFTTGYPYWRYTATTDNKNRYGSGASLPTSLTATTSRPNIRFALTTGGPPANDVGVQSILSPIGTINLRTTTNVPVRALVKNYGTNNQLSFAVRCTIYSSGAIYNNARTISLNAGDTVTVSFDNWTPIVGVCTVMVKTCLVDDNPTNDRKTITTTGSCPYYTGGPDVGNMRWIDSDTTGGPVYSWKDITGHGTNVVFPTFDDAIGRIPIGFNFTFYDKTRNRLTVGTNGALCLDSNAISLTNTTMPNSATPNNLIAALWDDLHVRKLGTVKYQTFGSTPNCTLVVSYDSIRYLGGGDSTLTFQFLLFEGSNNIIIQYKNVITGHSTRDAGLSATVGIEDSTGTIGLQYLYNGVEASNLLSAGRAIKFYYSPLANDVGVEAILSPLATHPVNTVMTPSAGVRNYGTANQTSFAVVCSIFGRISGLLYWDNRTISLNAGLSTTVNFNSWTPLVGESTTVKMATALVGDERTSNDIKTRITVNTVVVDAGVTAIARPYLSKETETKRAPFTPEVTVTNNGSFSADVPVIMEIWSAASGVSEGFEGTTFPPTDWDTLRLYGTDTDGHWSRVTSGTYPPCSPHGGTAMAYYYSFLTSAGNACRLMSPWFTLGESDVVDFWMMHDPGYNPNQETLDVEITTNGTTWTNIGRYDRYYATDTVWLEHNISLSAYAHASVRIGFTARSGYGNNMFIDDVVIGTYIPAMLVYRDSTSVNVLAGTDASATATFRPCTLMTEGSYTVKSYTLLSGDMVTANDMLTGTTTVTQATLTLSSPTNGSSTSDNTPTFSWNEVSGTELYRIEVDNNDDFSSPEFQGTLGDLEMESDPLDIGTYYWHVRVESPGTPDNYSETWTVTIYTPGEPGWTQVESIPAPLDIKAGKFMKDGGSVVGVGGTKDGDNIFMFPGNKSWYFYMYTPGEPGTFTTLESIPYGLKPTDPTKYNKKKIGKGAALCFDNDHTIYATKGNGTRELWAYDILANTWTQDSFVPVPKALKGGTSLAYLGGKIYLLAGGQKKTDLVNFYGYDIATAAWAPLGLLTLGPNVKVWKDGACLTELDGTLYALKSNDKYNPFFSYNVLTNTWTEFDSIPMLDSVAGKAKKIAVKDGGAMCAGSGAIYAIKGGGTIYFWKYTTLGGWTRQDTLPRLHKKSVAKTGASMAYANNRVFLMKGNNSPEFWQYVPTAGPVAKPTSNTVTAVMVEKTNLTNVFSFNVAPNPFNRTTIIRYTVPVAGKVSVKLYNTSGRVVETVNNSYLNAGNYTTTLNASTLANGVYFLRYEDNTNRAEIKLIVE